MQLDSLKSITKDWLKPPSGGYSKSPAMGFLIGFFFGPLGVGLFLRSLLDFALSLIMCLAVIGLVDGYTAPICWAACGIWVVARMKRDLPQALESRDAPGTSGLAQAWEVTTESRHGSA